MDYGHIDFRLFGPMYPEGFPLVSAGSSLAFQNKTITYFFMKLGSMPYLSTYILVMYSVSKRFFKHKFILIFSSLIFLLTYRWFIYRTLVFLPSTVANLLIFICLIIFLTKTPNYLIGFIIPAIYLIHPLSALFFIICVGIFYFIKFFHSFGELKSFFKEISIISILTIIFLIPLFIHSYIVFDTNIISYLLNYLEKVSLQKSGNFFQFKRLGYIIQSQSFFDSVNFFRIETINELFDQYTIGPFLLLSFFGLLIGSKTRNKNTREFILNLKFGFALTVIIYFLGSMFSEYFSNSNFIEFALYRPLETFAPQIILLAVLTIESLLNLSENLWNSLRKKYSQFIHSNKIKWISKNLNLKLFLIISIITSSFLYFDRRKEVQPNYYYNTLPELLLYVNNNIPKGSNLALSILYNENNEPDHGVYVLIHEYNRILYKCSDSLTYNGFYNFAAYNNIDYVLLKKSCLNYSNFLMKFENSTNFIKIYQVNDSDLHFGLYSFNI